jgi:hypothetical protein
MSSIASSNLNFPVLEKRFVWSVTSSMLSILAGLVVLTVVMSIGNAALNFSALLILAWPVSLLFLSLPSVKNKRNAKTEASTSAAPTNNENSGEYFPSWLGSKAYNAACADSQ